MPLVEVSAPSALHLDGPTPDVSLEPQFGTCGSASAVHWVQASALPNWEAAS